MVPMHAIGLALALPGKLAAALTKTSRHIDIALMGATRNNQSNIRASIPGGQTYSEVMSKLPPRMRAAHAGQVAGGVFGAAAYSRPDAHRDAPYGAPSRHAADRSLSGTQYDQPGTRIATALTNGVPRPTRTGSHFILGNRSDEPISAETRAPQFADRLNVVTFRSLRAASGMPSERSRRAQRAAVSDTAIWGAGAPDTALAGSPPTSGARGMTNERAISAPGAASRSGIASFERGSGIVDQTVAPMAIANSRAEQDRKSAGPAPTPSVDPAFAPVRRPTGSVTFGDSAVPTTLPLMRPPENWSSRGTGASAATGSGQHPADMPKNSEAGTSDNSGPTRGDVFLDGTLVGRWMAKRLAHEVGRPPSGGPAFDPSRSPFPPGRMIGG